MACPCTVITTLYSPSLQAQIISNEFLVRRIGSDAAYIYVLGIGKFPWKFNDASRDLTSQSWYVYDLYCIKIMAGLILSLSVMAYRNRSLYLCLCIASMADIFNVFSKHLALSTLQPPPLNNTNFMMQRAPPCNLFLSITQILRCREIALTEFRSMACQWIVTL